MNGKIVFLEIFYFFCSDRTIEQQLVKKLKNRRRPFPFDVKMYVRVKRVENECKLHASQCFQLNDLYLVKIPTILDVLKYN